MEIYILVIICFLCFVNNSISVEARYCKFEFEGQLKYYVCPRNEYCCNLGCCISPTFQFYQLWHYWLMVIFMFAVCSGVQWWYRHWVNNHGFLTDLGSAMPGRGPHGVGAMARDTTTNRSRGSMAPTRSASVAYHPATDAVVMHNIWKPPYPGRGSAGNNNAGPPPSYSQITQQVGSTSGSSSAAQQTSPKPPTPPYMQMYGPPPSYESVVGLSNLTGEHSTANATSSTVSSSPQVHHQPATSTPGVATLPGTHHHHR